VEADAVGQKYAMVIHPQYAPVTYFAMMCAVGLVLQALFAKSSFAIALPLDYA
jgi:hypothetical protein